MEKWMQHEIADAAQAIDLPPSVLGLVDLIVGRHLFEDEERLAFGDLQRLGDFVDRESGDVLAHGHHDLVFAFGLGGALDGLFARGGEDGVGDDADDREDQERREDDDVFLEEFNHRGLLGRGDEAIEVGDRGGQAESGKEKGRFHGARMLGTAPFSARPKNIGQMSTRRTLSHSRMSPFHRPPCPRLTSASPPSNAPGVLPVTAFCARSTRPPASCP